LVKTTKREREEGTAKALYTRQRGRWALDLYLFGEGDWVMSSQGRGDGVDMHPLCFFFSTFFPPRDAPMYEPK